MKTTAKTTSSPGRSSSRSSSLSPARRTRSSSLSASPSRQRLSPRKRSNEVTNNNYSSPPSNRRSSRKIKYYGGVQASNNDSEEEEEESSSIVNNAIPSPRRSPRKLVADAATSSNVASMPEAAANDSSDSDSDSDSDSSEQQQEQSFQKKRRQHPPWLPSNWTYQVIPRNYASRSASAVSSYYYSPKCGLRFRTKMEVEKFLQCLEVLGGGKKGDDDDDQDDDGQDEMDAYELYNGSFSEAKWKKRSRSVDSGTGGGRGRRGDDENKRKLPRFQRKREDEGGKKDNNTALFARSTRNNRNVPRRRYCDIEWDSSQDSGSSSASVVPDTVSSHSTGVKPDFIESSSSLARSSSRPKRGAATARSTGVDPDCYIIMKPEFIESSSSSRSFPRPNKRGRGRPKKQVSIGDLGYTFRKKFHEGWFTGKVVKIRPGAANDKDRRCLYDDGDEEDLSLAELKALALLDPSLKKVDSNPPISASSPISASNLPTPANGRGYTKLEAMEIITSFPKQCKGGSDGRERAKAIKGMLAKGWVPIAERNLYKYVEKYEKGIPITSEWHVSTRWKAELKSNPISIQPRSNPKLSRHLADKLDEYLEAGAKNKRWYMFFEKLKKFKSQYGTTEIYARTPGADEPLKNWTNRMRVECRKFASGVTDEKLRVDEMRFALLQSIGFKFDLMVRGSPNPASPTSSAPTRSSARKREIVPDQLVSSTVQSRSNSNLSRDLAEKLDEYLEADEKNKRWYMFYEKLKEFKSQYGTTEIYTRTPGADDSLKNWTKHMRLHCRKFVNGETFENLRIDEMRFALLQSIGFEFDLVRGYPNLASATSTVPASSARKREFVPDEVLSQVPPAFTMPSGKKARVSAAKEPSPEEQEVLLLDSLNDVPLDKTAESTLYSNLQTEDGVGGNDERDSDVNSDEEEEDNEWLHKVASLLTTEKSSKGQKRPPSVPPSRSISSITSTSPPPTWVTAVPDAVTLNQPDVTPSTQLKSIHQASSATSTTLGKSSTGEKKKKRYLADNIFYWICSCDTVNKYRYMECSSCSQDKNAYSKRSLMLEKAEKAVESDGVQLVQEAADYIPAIDRPAIPDKVIAYLLQQKIHGVTFSAFCSNPSNELDDYFYWLCGSCTMKNSYSRSSCTACLQPKSALADDSSLLATARQAAEKSKTVKEAIDLIPEKDRRAIPESILDGLVTCVAIIGKGRSKRRCKAARCAGFDYCVSHCDPLLVQKSRIVAQGSKGGDSSSWCSPTKPDASARGITKIIENLPTFLSGIHGKVVNNLNWSVNCIEDSILCGENKPFPLGLKVRKFFLGYGFHDGRIVKIVRKKLVDKEAKEQRPVLVYRIVYNDGDQEDFLHHEISSLRQVFDQANVSPEASSSVQIPTGTCFELKTGNTVTVVSHKTSQVCRNQEENDRLVVQFADSSKEAEIDLLKFQLAVVRKIFSSDSRRNNLDAPLLEWPRYGHGPENDSSQPDTYDISEGLTLSRQVYKSTSKNDVASSFTSSAIDNPRDARPGVKVRMWDPAECFNHLSYDPYAATVCEFCGVDNNANQVVICDKCHCGFHTYCLRPVMVNIPRGDWLCSACSGSSNSVPFEEYKNGIDQQEMMSFLGLPYQKATRFFREHSEAMDLFKEKSKNAIKQRALSLQIPSKQVIFEVGGIKFIRALENSDWRLPVPLLNKSEWATSLSTIVAAMKYCGVGKYSPDLLYPPIGHATEEMNNPELDVDKIHPMSKRNMEIFKAFNHNIKHGVFPPVRVLYDENMGFSVEALAPIQKYTLVGEYVGDVVTVDRSGTSNSDSLMLLLQTEDPETSLIIDPTVSGNYSRFFSGINNRNLLSKRKANVRTRRFAMDGKIHVALFTSRDVEAGEILSYDYNAGNHGKCVEEWAKAGFYDTSNFF